MKQYLSVFLVLLIIFIYFCASQKEYLLKEYCSKDEKEYYSNRNFEPFKPIDKDIILDFKRSYFKYKNINNYTPFVDIYERSPFQDSIENIENTKGSFEKISRNHLGIPLYYLINQYKRDSLEVILYEDDCYDDFVWGESGYWIAIKENHIWNKYYTGLSANTPIHIKTNSKLCLIKDKNTIQIESALIRLIEPAMLPVGPPQYELIKDGLVLNIDLNKIKLDSDGDGLTDIEEDKMMLNPNNNDTDSDGIDDFHDLNPRFKSVQNEKALIFESIINEYQFHFFNNDSIIPKDFEVPLILADENTNTYLIITNNPDIQGIRSIKNRYIIMTKNEYKIHKEKYWNTFQEVDISPLFKVDDLKNAYKIHESSGSGSSTYLIIIRDKDFIIKTISMSIV